MMTSIWNLADLLHKMGRLEEAEGLMRGLGITDPLYQAVLVQTALTRPQQEAVAHILEQSPQPPDVFQQLRAELTRIHGKSEWRRMGELFTLPPLGDQRPGELLPVVQFQYAQLRCPFVQRERPRGRQRLVLRHQCNPQ
jgi:hypothetical protein